MGRLSKTPESGSWRSEPSSSGWRSIIRLPVFLLANVALLFVIGVSTVRETYRGWTVDREIHALEAEAAALEGRRTHLETLARELVSAERVEYDARARLGQKMPDERVIVLHGVSPTTSWTGAAAFESSSSDSEESKSNPARWWAYFFN